MEKFGTTKCGKENLNLKNENGEFGIAQIHHSIHFSCYILLTQA